MPDAAFKDFKFKIYKDPVFSYKEQAVVDKLITNTSVESRLTPGFIYAPYIPDSFGKNPCNEIDLSPIGVQLELFDASTWRQNKPYCSQSSMYELR